MKIKKPHNFILLKKFTDKYFDNATNQEISYNQINEYPTWHKYEYDNKGNVMYIEWSDGGWIKYEYNNNGNQIYYEDCDGYWYKYEYDENGNKTYYENSNGNIRDYRR